ncbi:hypothetical protein [Actinomadura mexicana]|uniref:hypothetical protein n=1 Tax=Actinomadura mexicana TaxID=134959 RepID=UPI000B793D96|nr:hypothetical protein [Actinomadura mexicana]
MIEPARRRTGGAVACKVGRSVRTVVLSSPSGLTWSGAPMAMTTFVESMTPSYADSAMPSASW